MILPELYLDNSVVIGTNDPDDITSAMKQRAFATYAESLFTGKTITGYLSTGDTTDAAPISGLTWNFAEEGSLARYWAELLGSALTTNAAAFVGPQTPLYVHYVSGQDYHEIGGPVVVKGVRPLVGFPTSLVWDNDFVFKFKLNRRRTSDGQSELWTGASLNVFLSTATDVSATSVHASLDKSVGSGLTEIAPGEYVGGFEGDAITSQLAANAPIYVIAKVGQLFRAAAQLTVVKKRAA